MAGRPPLLVLNTCPCLFVELGEPKAPAKTSETIDLMSYFVLEVRTQLDAIIGSCGQII
jgi:hypothetical protein